MGVFKKRFKRIKNQKIKEFAKCKFLFLIQLHKFLYKAELYPTDIECP